MTSLAILEQRIVEELEKSVDSPINTRPYVNLFKSFLGLVHEQHNSAYARIAPFLDQESREKSEDAEQVCYPEYIRSIKVVDAKVQITTRQYIVMHATKTPLYEWVNVDENIRHRIQSTDGQGKPKFKKVDAKSHEVQLIYEIPISLVAEIMLEIGRSNLTDIPEDYIPALPGEDLLRALSSMGSAHPMMGMTMVSSRYGAADWFDHPKFRHRDDQTPFRLFLQPDDKGRYEVIVEPYSKTEITERRELIATRKEWAVWHVGKTAALKEYVERVRAKWTPVTAVGGSDGGK